jgi:hypothetical protein
MAGPAHPVPLDTLLEAANLQHDTIADLTFTLSGRYLAEHGLPAPSLAGDEPLAGFLFAGATAGVVLVRAGDPLLRRRFTAAHELGHYLLHFLPRFEAETPQLSFVQGDVPDNIQEEERDANADGPALPTAERQANLFAIELLMPADVCRALADDLGRRHRLSDTYLEHRLASALLVSRSAARARLRSLGLLTSHK